ncbi:MAG: hypothetical protein QME77_01180 [bacterium]|nr:hypothetical protein [bacterium]
MQRPVVWVLLPIWAVLLVTGPALSQSTVPQAQQLFDQARQAQSEGDAQKAIDLYLKAIEADPAMLEAYLVLGRLWVNIMEYRSAVDLLQGAKRRAPGHPEIRLWLIAGLFYWERCRDAVTEGREALAGVSFPAEEQATVLYFVGKCLHDLGEHHAAARTLEEAAAVELSARPTLFERENLARFIDQALILAYWGHLAVSPDDQESRLRLARVLIRRDDVLGPLRELRVIVAARPNWAEPYYWLGVVHLKLARASRNAELIREYFAAARRALETCVRLDPAGAYAEEARYLLLQIPRF